MLRGQEQLGIVQLGLRAQPGRVHAHAERQPRIGRGHIQRFGNGFRVVSGQDDCRHADALQYAYRRAHVRAVRHAALVVLDRDLRDHRPAGNIAQRKHRRTQRREGLRAAQIVEGGVLMQQRTERPLAQPDIVHRDRAFALVLVRDGRALEHQADRERVQFARPLPAGSAVRRNRTGKASGRLPVKRDVVRIVQKDLRDIVKLA